MGTALLSIGVRAMAASYAQMQTTSHNIANAGVQGYSRQTTVLETAQGQFSGVGFFGRGVDIATVQRSQDAFLTRESASSKALASMDATRRDRLLQLESAFRTGEQGIGHSISQLFSAMSDLASRPADGATRQVVLARAQDMVLRFNEAGEQLATLQLSVNQELDATTSAVNGLAKSLAKVNEDIAVAKGLGQEPNDLLDERDRLLSRLSEFVQVNTIEADDGSLAVFIGGGQRLVLGNMAEELQVVPDLFDGSRSAVAISEGMSLRRLDGDSMGGGSIAGLLKFQSQDMPAAMALLGQLSRAVADAVNDQQELGMNLQPPAGSVASQALFGFKDSTLERVLPASTNDRDISGQLTSNVTIEVVEPSLLRATEYDLRGDPNSPGSWLLSRVPADGSAPVPVSDGQQVDGFIVHFNSGPTAGDRFLLQPASRAATGMQRLLTDPLDLAAASPFVASAASTNVGSIRVDGLRMVKTPDDVQGSVSITFTAQDPSDPSRFLYDWELRDVNGVVIGGDTGYTWTPGMPIPSPPDTNQALNGFQLDVTGVPVANDRIEAVVTEYPETNNGNALALQRLQGLSLVGLTEMPDGSRTGGLTFNERFIAALADVGVRTQGAEATAAISAARADQAESARASKAGVNLDEEAARLIQYQQSYQAAAKVLQIAQQVFSNLLDIAR
jgi:flagellar hook-associated protein 1